MDWLGCCQDAIEAELARRHLAPQANPSRMALFDLSSLWMEGSHCPLAARGYSRDGKKGKLQIEYGLLTDPVDRPVAVRMFPGNTGYSGAFTQIVTVVRDTFGLEKMVMAGARGMITSAPIGALTEEGPLQLSLFDRRDLAEIYGDFPSAWLVACRNPVLAADRARTREELLAATEKLLAPVIARVQAGKLTGAGEIGVEVGKVISTYKTGKRFTVTITDDSLTVTRKQDRIDTEAAWTGSTCCAPPSPPASSMPPAWSPPTRTSRYVGRDFRRTRQGRRADLHARLLPHPAPCAGRGRRSPSPTRTRPPRATPSLRPAARRRPRPRRHASTTRPGGPIAASAACWTTWPP
jgi:hypothetical protein